MEEMPRTLYIYITKKLNPYFYGRDDLHLNFNALRLNINQFLQVSLVI